MKLQEDIATEAIFKKLKDTKNFNKISLPSTYTPIQSAASDFFKHLNQETVLFCEDINGEKQILVLNREKEIVETMQGDESEDGWDDIAKVLLLNVRDTWNISDWKPSSQKLFKTYFAKCNEAMDLENFSHDCKRVVQSLEN